MPRHTYTNRHEDRWGGLLVGLLLLGLGLMFLFRELGWIERSALFEGWWALILVVIGLAKLLRARRAKDLGGGVTLVLLGAWLYVAHTGWKGLDFSNSWPLALVAVGAGMTVRALAQRWMPGRTEHREEEDHV